MTRPRNLKVAATGAEVQVEIVALIAAIVSMILAGFAIWQANHHRDQSDKLNRDTTEKLARIEACATSTKEDAFAELKETYGWLRSGGRASEEAEKTREKLRKLKEDRETTTTAQFKKARQSIESKLGSSVDPSTISEIKKQLEELKKGISEIQEKAVVDIGKVEINPAISDLLSRALSEEKAILQAVARNPGWTGLRYLEDLGYESKQVKRILTQVKLYGLLRDRHYKHDRGMRHEFKLDEDLKEVLLRMIL